jgi:hypothetical protein
MNIQLLDGFQIKGQKINLLFYCPDNGQMRAQFWIPSACEEVVHEQPIKKWKQAVAALCVFMELNGEPREHIEKKVNNLISLICQNNLVTS